jgi:hypothetical protein
VPSESSLPSSVTLPHGVKHSVVAKAVPTIQVKFATVCAYPHHHHTACLYVIL